MHPTTQYAQDVVDGKINVCNYVRLSCQRHLDDLKRQGTEGFPFIFDESKADRFFNFTKLMCHYKAGYAGQQLELLPWQHFVLGSIYGWVEQRTGYFRFRDIHIEVPRKSGKSFMASGIALYDMAFLEKTGAEVYLMATKLDQARIVFKDAKAIIDASSKLQPHFEVLQNDIFSKSSRRTSFIKPLGSDSRKLDGLNPISAVFDELHEYKDRNLWDVIQGAFGARANYHTISITTAGYDMNGICYENREQLINILEGKFVNERKFGVIYTLDEGEHEEGWDKPAMWLKCNPSLGHGKQMTFMEGEAINARQVPSKLNDFLTKQLCIWVDKKSAWLSAKEWSACEVATPPDLTGKKCFVGLDLATVNDLSAVAYVFPKQEGLEKPYAKVVCYMATDAVREKEDAHNVPYTQYAKAGWIILTTGKTTDFDYIRRDIVSAAQQYKIESLSYDRFFSNVLIQQLQAEGINCESIPQSFVGLNGPTLELERLIKNDGIQFERNKLVAWQAGNVTLLTDSSGNVKPDKAKYGNKIDAIVAMIMAIGKMRLVIQDDKPEEPPANWDTFFDSF